MENELFLKKKKIDILKKQLCLLEKCTCNKIGCFNCEYKNKCKKIELEGKINECERKD